MLLPLSLAFYLQTENGYSSENIFVTGMSNGGDMSYMLACQADEIFKVASIPPEDVIKANELWVFNRKSRCYPDFLCWHAFADGGAWDSAMACPA